MKPVYWGFIVIISFMWFATILSIPVLAQQDESDGFRFLRFEIVGNDTIPICDLDEVLVTASRFRTKEQEEEYQRLKRNIVKVYPYAQRAIALIKQVESTTADLERRRDRKRYLHALEDELEGQFKEDLKKLSVSQGKVLLKMIERETGRPFYQLVKEFKNPISAMFWQSMGKSFGYDLKEGYNPAMYRDMEQLLRYIEQNGVEQLGIQYKPTPSLDRYQNLPTPEELKEKRKKK